MTLIFSLPIISGKSRNGWDIQSKLVAMCTVLLIDYIVIATYIYS